MTVDTDSVTGDAIEETKDYDVIVAGGGPAGSTTATLLAQMDHRVLLLEKAAQPEFKIGESLMPATYGTLNRLGVLDQMEESSFPEKHSVQFFSGRGSASSPFYFSETDLGVRAKTWQVLRSEFDPMLRSNAQKHGVTLELGTTVRSVEFDATGRAVGVQLRRDGVDRQVSAKVIVDATGQNALIGRTLDLREGEPDLERRVSFFTHFRGAKRDPGRDEGATIIYQTQDQKCWFWFIPLPDDLVSVGIVGTLEHLIGSRTGTPQSTFDQELTQCPALGQRLLEAKQDRPMAAFRDFSYRNRQMSGDGWVLVGDAFCFLDPIYSSESSWRSPPES